MSRLSMIALEACLRAIPFPVFNMPRGRHRAPADPLARLRQLSADAAAIQAQADAEQRALTPGEGAEIDNIFCEFERVEASLPPPPNPRHGRGRLTDPDDVVNGGFRRTPGADSIGRRDTAPGVSTTAPGIAARGWAALNCAALADRGSDMPITDFVRHVAQGIHDPRLIRAAQTEGTGAGGGFLVPTSTVAAVWDAMIAESVVLPRALMIPMATNATMVPHPDIANRTSSVAGVAGNWIAEGGTFGVDTAALTQTLFKLAKLGTLLKISNEWLDDVPSMNAQIFNALLAGVLAYDLDAAFFNGTGAGQPLGIINAGSAITITQESGQPVDTLLYQNVVNMWARLHPACWANSVWFCSPSCLPQLMTMAFDRAATDKVPVFLPGTGAAGAPNMTLLGRPLIVTEHQGHVGDKGDLILCDLSKYGVAMRPGIVLDRSEHRYFETDETALRGKIRADGRPMWNSAHTPRSDTVNTLSWAVMIEARA